MSWSLPPMKESTWREVKILMMMLMVIVSGSFNNVANYITSKPMKNYSFFLSLLSPIVYVLLYFTILGVRYFMKIVKLENLSYPWLFTEDSTSPNWVVRQASNFPPIKYFLVMGLMDGLGLILGFIARPYVSGPMVSLMSQSIIIFAILCAITILQTRYTFWQCLAAATVLAGAVLSLMPQFLNSSDNSDNSLFYCFITAISTFPNALSFALKELVFRQKKDLDLFVVNSHGSLCQLAFWPIFIPLVLLFDQTQGLSLDIYLKNAFLCFTSSLETANEGECEHMPWPYVVYISINLVYNISLLILLKMASALQGFMALKAILPITVILYYFNWPIIGSSPINTWDIGALVIIVIGLVLFRLTSYWKEQHPDQSTCCSLFLPFAVKKPPALSS